MDLVPKNWDEFQHYKNRRPPWIKLYRTLLDDVEFHCLPDASKALSIMLWLLASESETGKINADIKALAFRLRTTPQKIKDAIKPLIDEGFFVASGVLADCLQHAIPETETETETETDSPPKSGDSRFDQFWKAYPRKQGKGAAEKAFAKAKINGHFDSVLAALERQKRSEQWQKDGGQFIPNPATWLNQKRWEDEPEQGKSTLEDMFGVIE